MQSSTNTNPDIQQCISLAELPILILAILIILDYIILYNLLAQVLHHRIHTYGLVTYLYAVPSESVILYYVCLPLVTVLLVINSFLCSSCSITV